MNNCNSEIPLISFINIGRSLSTFEEKDEKITDHSKKNVETNAHSMTEYTSVKNRDRKEEDLNAALA